MVKVKSVANIRHSGVATLVLFALLVVGLGVTTPSRAELDVQGRVAGPMPSLAPMLEQVTPAVVNIAVVKSQRLPESFNFFGYPV